MKLSQKRKYILGLIIIIGGLTFAVTSITSANASSAHRNTIFKERSLHSKSTNSSKALATGTTADTSNTNSPAAGSNAAPNTSSKAVSQVSSSANPAANAPSSKITASTSTSPPPAPAPTPSPVSSETGDYDGYGYHVQDTQIIETISRATAQVCAGYLCGTDGPTISYNSTSPPAGNFQFVETRQDNVEFYIYSGGLSKGDSPTFSPVSINPDVPNGTYAGSIVLQLDTDTNDDYVNGPSISYTVYLTN
jgi:hypothetical protein